MRNAYEYWFCRKTKRDLLVGFSFQTFKYQVGAMEKSSCDELHGRRIKVENVLNITLSIRFGEKSENFCHWPKHRIHVFQGRLYFRGAHPNFTSYSWPGVPSEAPCCKVFPALPWGRGSRASASHLSTSLPRSHSILSRIQTSQLIEAFQLIYDRLMFSNQLEIYKIYF